MPLAGVALQSLASSVVGGVKRFQQLADTDLLSQNLHCPDDGAGQARSRIVIDAGRARMTTVSLSIAQVGGWSSSGATARGIIRPLERSSYRWKNVKLEVSEANRLVIEVDLNHRGDISASGKTKRVASTQGNVSVKDANGVEVKIGLNVYVKPAD